MTTPHEEQPQTEAPATPRVTTAPPRSRWRFGNVPSRLGRARTSTVVLAVLFVAVFVLWVYVRPQTVTTPAGTTSGVTDPAAPAATSQAPATTSAAPTTTAPTTTAPSETTTESSTSTGETTTGATTTTPATSSATRRSSTTSVGVPTTSVTVPTG
jgi:cytoskeletal protein RodZ